MMHQSGINGTWTLSSNLTRCLDLISLSEQRYYFFEDCEDLSELLLMYQLIWKQNYQLMTKFPQVKQNHFSQGISWDLGAVKPV